MKIKIQLSKKESKAIEMLRDGLKPMSINFGAQLDGLERKTWRDNDGSLNITASIAPEYGAKILQAYGEFLPVITANMLSMVTTLRGFFTRLAIIDMENKTHLKVEEEDKVA